MLEQQMVEVSKGDTGAATPQTEVSAEVMKIANKEKASGLPSDIIDGVTVSCKNLCKYVPRTGGCSSVFNCCSKNPNNEKLILDNISVHLEAGNLMGILGPSGSGKTTLLNLLAGRNTTGRITGEVLFNGRKQNQKQIRSFSNYVMAHDKLHAYLTVDETLRIGAKLKLPYESKEERKKRMDRIIADLGLQRCRQTYIGGEWKKGVSSGEMKRVSIAIEMLDNPKLLLLDEPTSGLDSSLALEVMSVLVALANSGRTIVMTIHQPRSQVFSMIDVMTLINKGRIVYSGAPDHVRPHFAAMGYSCPADWNPADFLLDLISDNSEAELLTIKNDSDPPSEDVAVKDPESQKFGMQTKTNAFNLPSHEVDALTDNWESGAKQKAINELIEQGIKNPGPLPSVEQGSFDASHWKRWPSQFAALFNRFFINSVRNPMVCCVMLCIQAVQGLVLGGIFFQISEGVRAIQSQPATGVADWAETTWAKMFFYGVDGNGSRPFVELIENGWDGHGSHPILELLSNPTDASLFHDIVGCLYTSYGLDTYTPTYPPIEFTPPVSFPTIPLGDNAVGSLRTVRDAMGDFVDAVQSRKSHAAKGPTAVERTRRRLIFQEKDPEYRQLALSLMEFTPAPPEVQRLLQDAPVDMDGDFQLVGDLISLLQLMDWFILKADFGRAGVCIENIDDSLSFYLCAMSHMDYLLNPLLTCIGLPELPGFKQPSPQPIAPVRRLNPGLFGALAADLDGILSKEMVQLFQSLSDVLVRLSSCGNQICDAFDDAFDYMFAAAGDSVNVLLIVLNLAGCIFFAVANLGFASYDVLLTFPQERAVFNHETANGLYFTSSYYLAKNCADLPFQIIPALTLSTVYYFMVGFSPEPVQFFSYFGICASTTFAAYGFGYMVSAASPRMEISVLFAPLTLVIWLVLAGFFLRDGDIPSWIDWFKYFSFYRWGFFALVTNQFRPGTTFGGFPAEFILALTGITDSRLWFTTLMLIVLGLGFRFVAYFFLLFTNRSVGIER